MYAPSPPYKKRKELEPFSAYLQYMNCLYLYHKYFPSFFDMVPTPNILFWANGSIHAIYYHYFVE
jgi:hypothetical protein